MQKSLTLLIFLTISGFIVSHLHLPVIVLIVLFIMLLFTPYFAKKITDLINQPLRQLGNVRQRKNKQKQIAANRDTVSFHFFKVTFQIAGCIAYSDSQFCDKERAYLDSIFSKYELQPAQISAAKDYFHEGATDSFSYLQAINELISTCQDVPELLHSFLVIQFAMAECNQQTNQKELQILTLLSHRLKLNDRFKHLLLEYRSRVEAHIHAQAQSNVDKLKRQRDKKRQQAQAERINKIKNNKQYQLQSALSLLNLKIGATPQQIKRAYRQQIKLHHPDSLLAQGYPMAFLKEATERSIKINKAYTLLKKHYKFR